MTEPFNPALILIVGALLLPLLSGWRRSAVMLALPAAALWYVLGLTPGLQGQVSLFGLTLVTLRVDALSLVFAYIFLIATFLSVLYALYVRDPVQQVAALMYAGAAVGAVFAGDLITLFVFWEITAVASVFLIWASRNERAYRAGMRYLIIQVGSGVILLAGIVVHQAETASIAFGHIGLGTLGGTLILVAFGIKAAFPLLHNWLQDAYPEATESGAVFLSAFTTKLAIYALARGYAGTEMLIWIGAIMALFPLFFAAVENDLRRMLAYILNNQLGFMVVGIGIGTPLALNGAVAHAFAHILYDGLLFMALGAVMLRAGTIRASDLGGVYRSMPWTTAFCIVGAASISAVPLFNGFVSKSLILSAAAGQGAFAAWLALLVASAGVVLLAGIRLPYSAFFGPDRGLRVREAPVCMLLGMAGMAILCVAVGVAPEWLYAMLPYPVDYQPYTLDHVVTQLQLIAFAALAFLVLMRAGMFPVAVRGINLDTDWIYRRVLPAVGTQFGYVLTRLQYVAKTTTKRLLEAALLLIFRYHGPRGVLARTWPISAAAVCMMAILGGFLIIHYL